jgi:hypothetical protein
VSARTINGVAAVPPARNQRFRPGPLVLARGLSLPGTGTSPLLIAVADHDEVTIKSRSPLPVVISVQPGYGQPLRHWRTLASGGTVVKVVATGKRYGYCFSQPAGEGYAATRACGALVMHEYFDGSRLPDGAAISERFHLVRR